MAFSAVAIAVGSLLFTSSVSALTLRDGAKVKCDAGMFEGTVECEGPYDGNDSNQIAKDTELFNLTGWKELTKIDGSSGSNDVLTVTSQGQGGFSWAFDQQFDLSNIKDLFFSVKGGPSFSVYLWDGTTTNGKFDTQGIVKGNNKGGPDLSHISIYYRNDIYLPPEAVPTPVAILPALAGLFGAAAKRKQQDKQGEEIA